MSDSCAAFPTSFDRFDHIWQVDFEYRQNRNLLPVPVCMCAINSAPGKRFSGGVSNCLSYAKHHST